MLAESEAITDVARFGEKKPLRFAFRELGIRLLDAAPGPVHDSHAHRPVVGAYDGIAPAAPLARPPPHPQPVDEFAQAAGLRTKPSLTHRNHRPDPSLK
jgi:hypothetical protein